MTLKNCVNHIWIHTSPELLFSSPQTLLMMDHPFPPSLWSFLLNQMTRVTQQGEKKKVQNQRKKQMPGTHLQHFSLVVVE